MDITVNRALLADRLGHVAKASSGRIIPIADCVLIQANDTVSITCTNTQFSMNSDFEAEVSKSGVVAVSAEKLLDIVKKLANDRVQLKEENGRLLIINGKSKLTLSTQPHEDFPIQKYNYADAIHLSKKDFDYLVTVKYAVSSEATTPVLTGINFKVTDSKLIVTATDRHKFSKAEIILDDQVGEFDATVPTNIINAVIRSKTENITFAIFGNHVFIKDDYCEYAATLLDGTYPDITRLVSIKSSTTVVLKISELLNKLELAALATDKNKVVKLTVTNDSVKIHSKDELLVVDEEVSAEVTGDQLEINLNVKNIIEALNASGSDTKLMFDGKLKPVVVDGDTINLIMPYKVS